LEENNNNWLTYHLYTFIMPKLKLTLQQVKENYKRDVTQRTKDRIEALTSETTNTENREDTNYAEEGVLDCRILAAKITTNQNKMDVISYLSCCSTCSCCSSTCCSTCNEKP
jgi:hypothetical protein